MTSDLRPAAGDPDWLMLDYIMTDGSLGVTLKHIVMHHHEEDVSFGDELLAHRSPQRATPSAGRLNKCCVVRTNK